jgi:hypothetical protein
MEAETKFERGEVVLVWNFDPKDSFTRVFSHMENGEFVCVREGYSRQFLAGENVPTINWEHAERLPKPSPFRKGELVVVDFLGSTWIAITDGAGRATADTRLSEAHLYKVTEEPRRPTIEELQKWLPWCEIMAKE